ncbi:hypothetical protein BDV06DRAFT_197586 [Aspergillus oleicola]
MRLLLEKDPTGINPTDWCNETAPLYVINGGYIDSVALLLQQRGIDVNIRGRNNETPIVRALHCERRVDEIIELLLNHPDTGLSSSGYQNRLEICG